MQPEILIERVAFINIPHPHEIPRLLSDENIMVKESGTILIVDAKYQHDIIRTYWYDAKVKDVYPLPYCFPDTEYESKIALSTVGEGETGTVTRIILSLMRRWWEVRDNIHIQSERNFINKQ